MSDVQKPIPSLPAADSAATPRPEGEGGVANVAVAGPVASAVLGRLESALAAAPRGPAPVERWNPPYCGDIGLAIARDGTWSYRGSPILRTGLVRLFARVLRRDRDGRHYLVTPVEKVDVAVEDAPFAAVEMELLGSGRDQVLVVRTNLDDIVRVGAEHPLRFALDAQTGGVKPYILVRGRLEALATRALAHELLGLIAAATEPGPFGIYSDGVFFAVPDAALIPASRSFDR